MPDESILDLLAARVAILGQDARAQVRTGHEFAEGMVVGHRPRALNRAWIVHRMEVLPELNRPSPAQLRKRTEEVLFPAGEPRNWRNVAVVESDEAIAIDAQAADADSAESCEIVHSSPQRVEMDVVLAADGLVVLSDLYYPGWVLRVETQGQSRRQVPILRTNRVMRGALLSPGRHRLVYSYRPRSVYYGGVISGIAAVLLIGTAMTVGLRRRVDREAPGPR
jgi:hypothetical protein